MLTPTSMRRIPKIGQDGSDKVSKKLPGNTTHSIPRRISSDLGNKEFLTLRGLLDKEFSGGAMTAIICATLALITESDTVTDQTEGSKFRYNDNERAREVFPSLFYAVERLYPQEVDYGRFIDHTLINSGFDVITRNTAIELCDLMLDILDN